MGKFYLYADESSLDVLSSAEQKLILIGGDFGYGNFGDVLQHLNAIRLVKGAERYRTVSVMAANAISFAEFPAWARTVYGTDAIIFVAEYPLIFGEDGPSLNPVGEIRNTAALHLYGGGFLNHMWGDYVISVVEYFLGLAEGLPYFVSGQQITPPFQERVLDHIRSYTPDLFGVRDEQSRQVLGEQGYDAHFSFDDATEALIALAQGVSLQCGNGLVMHLNSSDYTANRSLRRALGYELRTLASCDAAGKGVTVFQAFRDVRQDVLDATETIKQLEGSYPFHDVRLIDLVGLVLDSPASSGPRLAISAGLGYSCSYHVALWLQLAGIPCWLRSSNSFYDQKSRALQVTQGLEEFIRSPRLADHRFNLERRADWRVKLLDKLTLLDVPDRVSRVPSAQDGPAPWPFFYKGRPTLQEKLRDAEREMQWQRERMEVADHDLGLARSEIGELHGRVESLTDQLTAVGDEAYRQRERAEIAEYDLGTAQDEIGALRARVESLTEQLTEVGDEVHRQREQAELVRDELQKKIDSLLASRSWVFSRVFRVMARIFRGEWAPVMNAVKARIQKK